MYPQTLSAQPGVVFRAVACLLLFAWSTADIARAASPSHYSNAQASGDGIGKLHQGREIAALMGWQGAAWLEREEREREERGTWLLRELRLRPGMRVADIGAGTGYHARRIAREVGARGSVFAVDVQPEMIAILQRRARREGFANLIPLLGKADRVPLPAESVDLALLVDVYHELEYPFEMLASIKRVLAPGGRVVFVEYRAEDPRVPIKPLHRMSEAQVRKEVGQHGLVWERTADVLPWQHIIVFRKH